MAGQMVHVEIPAADTAQARAFWSALFGWELQAFEGSWFATCKDTEGNDFGVWQNDVSAA